MKRTLTLIALAALIFTTGTALAADSRKLPQQGTVDGDPGASVRLVVIKQGGSLKSVKGTKFKDLLADCDTGPEMIELNLFGAAEIDPDDRTFTRSYVTKDDGIIRVEGTVARSGKRVIGAIKGSKVNIQGVGACKIPSVSFVTKR